MSVAAAAAVIGAFAAVVTALVGLVRLARELWPPTE